MGLRVKLLYGVDNRIGDSIFPYSFTHNLPVHRVEGRLKVDEHKLRDLFFILPGFPVIHKLLTSVINLSIWGSVPSPGQNPCCA